MPARVIAIDGPVGSGKTTLGLALAARLEAEFLDTGATFRALALEVKAAAIDPDDIEAVAPLLERVHIKHGCRFETVDGQRRAEPFVELGGVDVSGKLFEEDIGDYASRLSAHKEVREFAVRLWRERAGENLIVAAGRDLTSNVFPDALLKIYLDCSLKVRARRRADQLRALGEEVGDEEIEQKLLARDERDSTRETAPLTRTKDSCYISTDALDPEQTVRLALRFFQRETGGRPLGRTQITDHYHIPPRMLITGSVVIVLIMLGYFWAMTSRSASDGALADLKKYTSLSKEKREGLKLYKQGEDEAAEELFKTALSEDPQDPELLNYLGIISARRGELEVAEDYFQRSVEADPEQSEAWLNLATLSRHSGDLAATESRLNRALKNNPDSYLIKTSLAEVEFFQGKTEPTLDMLKRLHAQAMKEMGSGNADMQGVVEKLRTVITGSEELGGEDLEKREEIDKLLGSTLNLLGIAAARDGEAVEARFYFRLAITAAPAEPAAYNNLGSVFEHEGDLKQARRLFELAVDKSGGAIPVFAENLGRVEEMLGEEDTHD